MELPLEEKSFARMVATSMGAVIKAFESLIIIDFVGFLDSLRVFTFSHTSLELASLLKEFT